jgi:hypothetical protein
MLFARRKTYAPPGALDIDGVQNRHTCISIVPNVLI